MESESQVESVAELVTESLVEEVSIDGMCGGLLIVGSAPTCEFDLDVGWRLHPQVAVRPEPFGALLYHFGTRKLSFLKNRTVLALIESLDAHPDVRSACRGAGIDDDAREPYLRALATLVASNMLVPKENP